LWDLKVAVQPDFECRALIEHQVVTRLECGVGAIRRARARTGGCSVFAALVSTRGSAFAGSYHHGLGDFFFGHPFTSDLAFLANLAQSVFAGDSGYGSDERDPSMLSFDFVKTQQKAGVQPWFDSAYVAFDLPALIQRGAVGSGEGLR
jgi:hypothetical protein